MIRETSYIKRSRLIEFKEFIRNHTPSARFVHNPLSTGNEVLVSIDIDAEDSIKLASLYNKWHDEDNFNKETPIESLLDKILNKCKNIFKRIMLCF